MYDLIIIGSGPAGLSAAVYAKRAGLNMLVIEKNPVSGGQIIDTYEVDNYLGIPGVNGFDLAMKFREHADKLGAEFVSATVTSVELRSEGSDTKAPVYTVKTDNGEFDTHTIILATGAHHSKLDIPGEEEFIGKGVSYCATCDAAFYEDFEVFVVGGGDSAVEEALYLTKFARKVTMIVRRDVFRAAKSIQDKAFANPKLDIWWNTSIVNIEGDGLVNKMTLIDNKTKETREYYADEEDGIFGIFVFIGFVPATKVLEGKVAMDERGYIITDENMHTNIPGVFAAGDCRVKSLRQVVTAAADGAIAAVQAGNYVDDLA